MNLAAITVVLAFALSSGTAVAQSDPKLWAQAERDIRRVAPLSYRALPRAVARYLVRRGYTIPQSYDTDGQHNAVRGHFDDDDVPDWAVLASRGGASQILVFWGGCSARVATLNRRPDADFLQGLGEERIGYSRTISVAGRANIIAHYRAYGGRKPPRVRHDAIDDGFSGKASSAYYYERGRWRMFHGAD